VRIPFTKNNCVFDKIRGVIVRVYNYEKLNLISKNDIDEVFLFNWCSCGFNWFRVNRKKMKKFEYVLMLELGENCI